MNAQNERDAQRLAAMPRAEAIAPGDMVAVPRWALSDFLNNQPGWPDTARRYVNAPALARPTPTPDLGEAVAWRLVDEETLTALKVALDAMDLSNKGTDAVRMGRAMLADIDEHSHPAPSPDWGVVGPDVRFSGRKHDLKCWPEAFAAIRTGCKQWELRLNDRDYQIGDLLRLREWDNHAERYTGEATGKLVIWMLNGPAFGLPDGYCIMSLDTRQALARAQQESEG